MVSMSHDEISIAAGQVLIAGFPGHQAPPELLDSARQNQLGGVILFKRNINSLSQVSEALSEVVEAFADDKPPMIAVDQEGGRVQRFGPPVLQLPPMRTMGDIDDPALTERAAALLGEQLRCLGFNICFAPVLDIDTNPDNPIIGNRSFGRTSERVIRHGLAFARGLESASVLSCGKHFPGHGDTDLDSHLALPRLPHSLERLESVELQPFRATADAIPTLMTAHVIFEAIDPELPATICPEVITGVLREKLGYRGLVFSDDLEMKALSDHESAWRAIEAGCDVLLVCSDADALALAREGLIRRATDHPAFRQRLQEAAERHLSLRRKYRPIPHPEAEQECTRLAQENHAPFTQSLAQKRGS